MQHLNSEVLKILVTGGNGQLGSELKSISRDSKYEYTFVDLEELDISSQNAIHSFFEDRSFDFIINCAAYTAVDKAEEDPATAYLVNGEAVRYIANVCKQKNIRLIHVSTDYVFDGESNQPITESMPVNPLSVYGKSKLEGENFVLNTLSDAYIIRTAWVYSTYGKNFVKTIAKLAREKDFLNVVYDQVGSPTYARDLAEAIVGIISKIELGIDSPGIYHYSNEGVTSWYDFAWMIVKYYSLPCKINPIRSEDYKTAAVRPKFTVLDKGLIKKTFGTRIPHWKESLTECLDTLATSSS